MFESPSMYSIHSLVRGGVCAIDNLPHNTTNNNNINNIFIFIFIFIVFDEWNEEKFGRGGRRTVEEKRGGGGGGAVQRCGVDQ